MKGALNQSVYLHVVFNGTWHKQDRNIYCITYNILIGTMPMNKKGC